MLKTKMVISFLLAPRRSSLARTNALQLRAREKDIWSGKAQRSLRKKRFANRPRSDTRRNLVGQKEDYDGQAAKNKDLGLGAGWIARSTAVRQRWARHG